MNEIILGVTSIGLFISIIIILLSTIMMKNYMSERGKKMSCTGIYIILLISEYLQTTKDETGSFGIWFKMFALGFSSMMFMIAISIIMSINS